MDNQAKTYTVFLHEDPISFLTKLDLEQQFGFANALPLSQAITGRQQV